MIIFWGKWFWLPFHLLPPSYPPSSPSLTEVNLYTDKDQLTSLHRHRPTMQLFTPSQIVSSPEASTETGHKWRQNPKRVCHKKFCNCSEVSVLHNWTFYYSTLCLILCLKPGALKVQYNNIFSYLTLSFLSNTNGLLHLPGFIVQHLAVGVSLNWERQLCSLWYHKGLILRTLCFSTFSLRKCCKVWNLFNDQNVFREL